MPSEYAPWAFEAYLTELQQVVAIQPIDLSFLMEQVLKE